MYLTALFLRLVAKVHLVAFFDCEDEWFARDALSVFGSDELDCEDAGKPEFAVCAQDRNAWATVIQHGSVLDCFAFLVCAGAPAGAEVEDFRHCGYGKE